MTDDDRRAIELGKRWLNHEGRINLALLERWWRIGERPARPCSLCDFRPMDRGADHKAKHEHWARELATLERMYTLPFTPNRRTER